MIMILSRESQQFEVRRVVLKLGTKQITDTTRVNTGNIAKIAAEVAHLREEGIEFILVVSGAIGMGLNTLGKNRFDSELSVSQKQAIATVGQVALMETLREVFERHGIHIGQVLLTHYIFENRKTYLNAENTLSEMLNLGILPVINENDSVATNEIRVGDNDNLGAHVALLTDADLYIMLTDTDGFYKDFGSKNQKLLKIVNLDENPELFDHAGSSAEEFTTGGMKTKLLAAKRTALSCIPSVIADGFERNVIDGILSGEKGTLFVSGRCKLSSKKRWMSGKKPKGAVVVDSGAMKAVLERKSLLLVGISGVEGDFLEDSYILIRSQSGDDIAIGKSRFSSDFIDANKRKHGDEIDGGGIVIHADDLVLF